MHRQNSDKKINADLWVSACSYTKDLESDGLIYCLI